MRHSKLFPGALLPVITLLILNGLFLGCAQNGSNSTPEENEDKGNDKAGVLVFSRTKGYYHESIPAGLAAIQKLGSENNFQVDTTKDASKFTTDNLKKYKAIIFLSTTGDVLNAEQQSALEDYIKNGGGFVGIHAAADTEYEWPWYNKLVGGYFKSHPNNPNVRKAVINVLNKEHLATQGLPDKWERNDEWYNYKDINPELTVLAKLDEKSYEGGENGDNHPIIWYHEYDGGRAFYTGGGHTKESYEDTVFMKHVLGGIRYAMGEK
jgi:cytochrome c